MKNVTFKISYSVDADKKSGFSINVYCGDADELPIPIYMAILKAMLQVDDILNGPPQEDEVKPIKVKGPIEPSALPPPPAENSSQKQKRMRKLYTEEEKAEIAQLYRDGVSVADIAERFGRQPSAIYKLAHYLGIDRGETPETPAAPVEPAGKESVLKKPWYLQSQKPNNSKKIVHE